MERGNVEVLHSVSLISAVVGMIGLTTTFFDLEFWSVARDVIGWHRLYFAGLILLGLVFGWLSRRYLEQPSPRPGTGEALVMSLTLTMLALGIWITLLDYPYLGRYFYLLCTLILLFGLLFIPPAHTFVCMLATFIVSFTALNTMGLMSSVQAVTLLAYCCVIALVSAAKYRSMLRSGQSNERMRASARHDELTGMLNRMGLDEDANGFVGKQIAVLLSDIDEFKSYNDLYGHEVGDLMLQEHARAMRSAFGDNAYVYRYGGDEFVVIASKPDRRELEEQIQQWRSAFHNCKLQGMEYNPTCSAGCVFGVPNAPADLFDMLHVADLKLYEAKENGRNQVVYAEFSPELLNEALAKSTTHHADSAAVDPLTGLVGSDFFYAHASTAIPALFQRGRSVDFVYFNVRNLKAYNDRHGYERGDELLCCVAQSIHDVFPNRLVARFGDDRFVLMTEDEGIIAAIERVFELVSAFDGNNNSPLRAGIYRMPSSDTDVRIACDCARLACDSIRSSYARNCCYYSEELAHSVEQQQRVLQRFDAALTDGRIQPWYQPIVRSSSDLVSEFEVLARWDEPGEGILLPEDFLPALEDARMVQRLDLHVLDLACAHYAQLGSSGHPCCPFSINVSHQDLDNPLLIEQVGAILTRHGIDPSLLHIEITENAFMQDTELVRSAASRFHQLGCQVWMDDFGSGQSPINVLRDCSFDAVKINMRPFCRENGGIYSEQTKVMITHLVGMCKEMNMQTVAVGVESIEQLLFLRSIGCEKLQGTVFGAPVAFDKLCACLADHTYYLESPEQHAYFTAISDVNLLKPFDTAIEPDPTGVCDGLPVAVLEWDGCLLHYVLTNEQYLRHLPSFGFNDLVDSEMSLNLPPEQGVDPLRAHIEEVIVSDSWVPIPYGDEHAPRMAYARHLADASLHNLKAILFVGPPLS